MKKIKKVLGHIKENIGMFAFVSAVCFLAILMLTIYLCEDNIIEMGINSHNKILANLDTRTVVMTVVKKSSGDVSFDDFYEGYELKVVDGNNKEYSTSVDECKFNRLAVDDKLPVEVEYSEQGHILNVYTYWEIKKTT